MMTDLLLIIIPLAIMGVSVFVFAKGYLFAKESDHEYSILSALEAPVPAEDEAKQLIMEFAEAMNGRYSEAHKMQHTLKWMDKLDQHVQRNKYYYRNEVALDKPLAQLAETDQSKIVSLFKNR